MFSAVLIASLFSVARSGEKLLQSNILFRHGDRSPYKLFPTYEYQESAWPEGLGQLLKKGMRREYELGKFLRRRFTRLHLLREYYYHKDEVYVRSTDLDRTLMSAGSLLAGLFPPKSNESFTEEIGGVGWRPVPIHTVPNSMDILLNENADCPKLAKMLEDAWRNSPEIRREKKRRGSFWRRVLTEAGSDPDAELLADNVHHILDCITIAEMADDKRRPAWISDEERGDVERLLNLSFKLKGYDDEMARLGMGTLLGQIRTNMANVAAKRGNDEDDGKPRKLYLYSDHDGGIAIFMRAMRVFNDVAPPYASAVMVELWQKDAERARTLPSLVVRVFYRNDTNVVPTTLLPLQLPECETDCPLKQFLFLTKNMVPTNRKRECAVDATETRTKTRTKGIHRSTMI